MIFTTRLRTCLQDIRQTCEHPRPLPKAYTHRRPTTYRRPMPTALPGSSGVPGEEGSMLERGEREMTGYEPFEPSQPAKSVGVCLWRKFPKSTRTRGEAPTVRGAQRARNLMYLSRHSLFRRDSLVRTVERICTIKVVRTRIWSCLSG